MLLRRLSLLLLLLASLPLWADDDDFAGFEFNDAVLEEAISYPAWFRPRFLDLESDRLEAQSRGKTLVTYFGQKHCAYCQALMEVNFKAADIVGYTRENFEIVPIDIWSSQEITDPKGETLTEREYALRENTNFTPSLLFYNDEGEAVFRLRGYYPPYKFLAALEYVADKHYQRESFADYLGRGDPSLAFEPGSLNEEEFFSKPPYAMDRSRFPAARPLAVFFEQTNCHACDVLHTGPLQEDEILQLLEGMDTVQLGLNEPTPVVTPGGERIKADDWAKQLGLFYTPTVLFFDENGREIIRVDSVVHFYRLRNVLRYVLSGDYKDEPNYLHWRAKLPLEERAELQ